MTIMVEELTTYTSQDIEDLDKLMHELSVSSYCNESILNNVMNDVNSQVFVIHEDGHIIATGTLCVKHTLEFTLGDIESVVVSFDYRGKGYGKELMMALMMNAARDKEVDLLHLTSNPKREAANRLYQSIGFEQYDTNCYKLDL